MKRKHAIGLGVGVVALLLMTAGASAWITQNNLEPDAANDKVRVSERSAPKENISWNESKQPVQQVQAQPNCDDGNVVGHILGGAAGGIAGSSIGDGKGKTAATIGGTLGGAYLGGEYIPTRNVTCK